MSRSKDTVDPPSGSPEWRLKRLANAPSVREEKTRIAPARAVLYARQRDEVRSMSSKEFLPPTPPSPREVLVKSAEVLAGTVVPDTIEAARELVVNYSAGSTTRSSSSRSSSPPSVASLTGIPVTSLCYDTVEQPLENTETPDRKVSSAKHSGEDKSREPSSTAPCLRCTVRQLPCSLEWLVGADVAKCTRCVRNGCEYCVRVIPYDPEKSLDGGPSGGIPATTGFEYVKIPGIAVGIAPVVDYVRNTRVYNPDVLQETATALLQERDAIQQKGRALPSWKEQVIQWRGDEAEREAEWVKECEKTGLAHPQLERDGGEEPVAQDSVTRAPSWSEYFERRREELREEGIVNNRRWNTAETWGIMPIG